MDHSARSFAPANCDKLFTWNVTTRAVALVSGPKTGRCGSDEPHGQLIREVAVAGTHLAWIRNITGNTETDDSLYTATLPTPSETTGPLWRVDHGLVGRWTTVTGARG